MDRAGLGTGSQDGLSPGKQPPPISMGSNSAAQRDGQVERRGLRVRDSSPHPVETQVQTHASPF